MQDCIFCKIVRGELPSETIYTDEQVIVFMDIHPTNPGHVLIVPRDHHESTLVTPEPILAHMAIIAKRITPAVMAAVQAEGFNLGANTGKVAGQVVMHTHWHIIPRHSGDGLSPWRDLSYKEGEMQEIANRIREAL